MTIYRADKRLLSALLGVGSVYCAKMNGFGAVLGENVPVGNGLSGYILEGECDIFVYFSKLVKN